MPASKKRVKLSFYNFNKLKEFALKRRKNADAFLSGKESTNQLKGRIFLALLYKHSNIIVHANQIRAFSK